jgi:Subtilase family
MIPGFGFPRRPHWLIVAAVTSSCLLAPASAAAMAGPPNGLSPRLAELAKPSVRSASDRVQAKKLGLASEGPGSILRKGNRVLVYVRFDHGAAAVDALRAAGAEIVNVSRRYQTVTVATRPSDLAKVAAVAGVAGVTEALSPVSAASTCPAGKVVSEGVKQLNAGEGTGEARKEFAVDGSGVTVGILSDSFDQATEAADGSGPVETHAKEDEESGDLPGAPRNTCPGQAIPVLVLEKEELEGGEEPTDEGRAMTQIVHDLAPGAKLDFASAFNGETAFAKNIGKLVTAGANVIADDVFYFEEPFFQDGPVAVGVNEAVEAGVTYFSAAGNDNLIDSEGHDIASWETPKYRDAGSCPPEVQAIPGANGTHCLDFNPGSQTDKTFGIEVEPGATLTVDLQWDEPWNGVKTDLDAFLLNANGNLIAASGEDNINVSKKPLEVVQWENESTSPQVVQLVINRFAGSKSPRLKFGLLENGFGVAATEYPRSTGEGSTAEDVVGPTVLGHSGSSAAISAGAVPFNALEPSLEPEEYSSRGPVRHDFGPVKGTEAAAQLGSPEILSKPDLAATDCGLTTFFAFFVEGQGWRFCGTSAAAPHAAGVAALMLDADAGASPAEVRTALQASAESAVGFDPCAVGAGLVEAVGAIEELPSPPPFTPTQCLPPEPEGSVEEARAPGNWGLEAPPPAPTPTPTATVESPPPAAIPPRPRTFLRQHPPHLILTHGRTAKVVFRFGSNETGVTFVCRIDGAPFRPCPARLVRRFPVGPHTLQVIARDSSGNGDLSPAIYRFKVKQAG